MKNILFYKFYISHAFIIYTKLIKPLRIYYTPFTNFVKGMQYNMIFWNLSIVIIICMIIFIM